MAVLALIWIEVAPQVGAVISVGVDDDPAFLRIKIGNAETRIDRSSSVDLVSAIEAAGSFQLQRETRQIANSINRERGERT